MKIINNKELIKMIRNDESIIKKLAKNIKKIVEETTSFDDEYENRIKKMQKKYTDSYLRLNKIREIYETNNPDAESD